MRSKNKECPFKIDYVEKGLSSTSFELSIANPDIIFASWCGKKLNKDKIIKRNNWHKINAVKNNDIYEIKSPLILQPGPAALTDGVNEIHTIIKNWNSN